MTVLLSLLSSLLVSVVVLVVVIVVIVRVVTVSDCSSSGAEAQHVTVAGTDHVIARHALQ